MQTSNDLLLAIANELNTNDQLPAYIYDLNIVKQKFAMFQKLFSAYPATRFLYAMKANWNKAIIKKLDANSASFDTVSPAEVHYLNQLGIDLQKVMFTANNSTLAEMQDIHKSFKTPPLFNIGSLDELEEYGKLFPNDNVCLRFNPVIGAEGKAGGHTFMQTTGQDVKFGILITDKDKAIAICKKYNLNIIGIHKHTGSCIAEKEKFISAIQTLLSLVNKNDFPNLKFVDFGGGFYVPYSPTDITFDYENFANEVISLVKSTNTKYGKELEILFEPGKSLVAECGTLLTTVISVKNNAGFKIIGTNSGMNHLMRPVLYNAYHKIDNLTATSNGKEIYDIVGNICESGDFFAKRREINTTKKGDILAIRNAGAYCETMGGIYNLRQPPAVVIIDGEQFCITRKRISNKEFAETIL